LVPFWPAFFFGTLLSLFAAEMVAMTAPALKGDQDRCMVAAMDGYVSGPIRSGDLFSVMERMLVSKPAVNSLV
jgi:CheY-like chemotaxis protein